MRALAPMLLGVAPFGLIYGVLAVNAGMPAQLACAMSAIVFGGASQMILTQLWAAGTPAPVMAPDGGHGQPAPCAVLGHHGASAGTAVARLESADRLLTDEAFAAMMRRLDGGSADRGAGPYRHWYFFGAGFALWAGWRVSTLAGVLVGAQVPRHWPLDFFLPLTFIGIIVPALKHRAQPRRGPVASALAVACHGLPHKSGLMAAALGGIAAGMLLRDRGKRSGRPASTVAPRKATGTARGGAAGAQHERHWSCWPCSSEPASPLS